MPVSGDLAAFGRLIHALEPWLDRVVIVGGWAHRLYRLHPHAQPLDYDPLLTLDADVALDEKTAVGEGEIRERLRAAGFQEELLGSDHAPTTHYWLGGSQGGFYAEFLTPLIGGEYGRDSRRRVTTSIGGITAQRLRHPDILLDHPWRVELDLSSLSFGAKTIRIASPVRFLAQKLLILKSRSWDKRANDILYIHDTLELFGPCLAELRQEWEVDLAPRLPGHRVRTIRRAPETFFAHLTDEIRGAARAAIGRDLTAEQIRESCAYGLRELFAAKILTR